MAQRMNISVPDDIRGRMEKVEEPVNWSAIATRAFVEELGKLAEARKGKKMDDVIDRLRASKQSSASASELAGVEAGRAWAMHEAAYPQLERVIEFSETYEVGANWNAPYGGGAYAAIAALGLDIENERRDDVDEQVVNFWGDDHARTDDDLWLDGWLTGASQVWDEVQAKL